MQQRTHEHRTLSVWCFRVFVPSGLLRRVEVRLDAVGQRRLVERHHHRRDLVQPHGAHQIDDAPVTAENRLGRRQGRVAHAPRRHELGREVVDGGDVLVHAGRRLADADRLDDLGGQPIPHARGVVGVPDVFSRPVLRHDKDRQLVELRRDDREPVPAGEARVGDRLLRQVAQRGRDHHHAQRSGDVAPRPAQDAGDVRLLFCRQGVVVGRRLDPITSKPRHRPAEIVDRRGFLHRSGRRRPLLRPREATDDRHDANHADADTGETHQILPP